MQVEFDIQLRITTSSSCSSCIYRVYLRVWFNDSNFQNSIENSHCSTSFTSNFSIIATCSRSSSCCLKHSSTRFCCSRSRLFWLLVLLNWNCSVFIRTHNKWEFVDIDAYHHHKTATIDVGHQLQYGHHHHKTKCSPRRHYHPNFH